jgi:hypothetical protein
MSLVTSANPGRALQYYTRSGMRRVVGSTVLPRISLAVPDLPMRFGIRRGLWLIASAVPLTPHRTVQTGT